MLRLHASFRTSSGSAVARSVQQAFHYVRAVQTKTCRQSNLVCAVSSARHQQPLSNAERKAKRAESQRLGKKICTVNMGKSGMTESFLKGLLDAQSANEFVKVRIGNVDGDMQTIADQLSQACDSVVVHSIGFTLTLYRDTSLPRRSPEFAAAVVEALERGERVEEGTWAAGALAQGGSPAAAAGAAGAGVGRRDSTAEGAATGVAHDGGASGGGEGGSGAGPQRQGDSGGGEVEEQESDSDDDCGADEVDVVVDGVKRRIQKPPEFTIIG